MLSVIRGGISYIAQAAGGLKSVLFKGNHNIPGTKSNARSDDGNRWLIILDSNREGEKGKTGGQEDMHCHEVM
jgi:hypothetical protein